MSDDQILVGDKSETTNFAGGDASAPLYQTDTAKPTRKELGLMLERQTVSQAQGELEESISAVVGWSSFSVLGLFMFAVGVALDTLSVTPVLFERLWGCEAGACIAVAGVTAADLVNWGIGIAGAFVTTLGLVKLRFDRVAKLRLAFQSFVASFRSSESMRPVFISSSKLSFVIEPEGLRMKSTGRELFVRWAAFDGVDLIFDEAYNSDPPETFDHKGELERLSLEDFLHSPGLPEPLAKFRAEAEEWARKNDSLRLPLKSKMSDAAVTPKEAKARAKQSSDTKVEKARDYILVPKRVFTNTIEGLAWTKAAPAILYMIFSRDDSVTVTRKEMIATFEA